jgi:hypothetical protein
MGLGGGGVRGRGLVQVTSGQGLAVEVFALGCGRVINGGQVGGGGSFPPGR